VRRMGMKQGTVFIAVVGVLGLLVVGTVSAYRSNARHVPTTITHDSAVLLSSGQTVISGHLDAPLICTFFRGVKVKAHYPNGTTRLLDQDLASNAGAWAVKANVSRADRLKAIATREVVHVLRVSVSGSPPGVGYGKAHHGRKVICDAASVVWGLD
jgi:hypothetical protein